MTGANDSVKVRMKAENISEKIAQEYYDDLGRLVRFSFRTEISRDFFWAMPDLMRKMPDFVFHDMTDGKMCLVEVKGCKQVNLRLKVGDFFHYDAWSQFTGLPIILFIVDYDGGGIYVVPFVQMKKVLSRDDVILTQTHDGVNWFEIDYNLIKGWRVKDL